MMKANVLYQSYEFKVIKSKLQYNYDCKDRCYWIAGYSLLLNRKIQKIIPTFVYVGKTNITRKVFDYSDYLSFYDENDISIYDIPRGINSGNYDEQIYISDSKEEVIKMYNSLVLKSFKMLEEEIEEANIQKSIIENDFYESNLVMEALTQ